MTTQCLVEWMGVLDLLRCFCCTLGEGRIEWSISVFTRELVLQR